MRATRSLRRCALLTLVAVHAAGFALAELPAGGEAYGAPLALSDTTPLAEILARPEAFAGAPVLIRAQVADVCQKKGCWTVLRDGEAHVRVTFADYGFFLPKQSRGAEALAEGTVSVVTLSEREARHYAAEASDGDPDAIVGPQREVSFVASGVRLLPRD